MKPISVYCYSSRYDVVPCLLHKQSELSGLYEVEVIGRIMIMSLTIFFSKLGVE